jgi:hypothetical protein
VRRHRAFSIVSQGVNGSTARRTTAVKLTVTGPPSEAITAAFNPATPVVGMTDCTISGHSTSGGWVTDISTFPDGSTHSFSFKSNGAGSYTNGPFVLKQLGTYHDVLIDSETGGRKTIVYQGVGDFRATINEPTRTVMSGQDAQFLVTFSSLSGFGGLVRPSVANVSDLAGTAATWSLRAVAARPGVPGSARLTIKTASVRPPVILRIHVEGTNGSVAHTAPDIVLRIVQPQSLRQQPVT